MGRLHIAWAVSMATVSTRLDSCLVALNVVDAFMNYAFSGAPSEQRIAMRGMFNIAGCCGLQKRQRSIACGLLRRRKASRMRTKCHTLTISTLSRTALQRDAEGWESFQCIPVVPRFEAVVTITSLFEGIGLRLLEPADGAGATVQPATHGFHNKKPLHLA